MPTDDASCAAPATSRWPEERAPSVCGTQWQDDYTALHAQLVASPSSSRILVFDCRAAPGQGGLADRLTGMMTALLLAILSGRAFQLDWPGVESAYATPRLDATGLLGAARAAPASEMRTLHWVNRDRQELHELVSRAESLDALWPERVLVVQSNRGFTQGLLRDSPRAAALGLTPESAQFGCLLHFLLEPTAAALAPLAPLRDALAAAAAPVVGVHVRTGDSTFAAERGADADALAARGAKLYADHRFVFDFALRRAAALDAPAAAARILVLSDSAALRAHAAAALGERALDAASNETVGHVARDAGALARAVGEHWLYGACDEFAYSSHSGYPRTAAARAMRPGVIHTCFHYEGPLYAERKGGTRPKRECSGPWTVTELGDRHAAGL